jgi:formamidopyrimidine-DNA glycosylase
LPAKKFVQLLKGKKILAVERRAKLLIFKLSGGFSILAHLKMSGKFLVVGCKGGLRVVKGGKEGLRGVKGVGKHTHVIFKFSGGKELHWNDVRKFGFLKLVDGAGLKKYLDEQNYGPEPLDNNFTWAKMARRLRLAPKKKIKPRLLDQTCIAGIGNIYATEALWSAKINPKIPIGKISDEKMKFLHHAIVNVLKKSIAARGTSADSYVDAFGEQGEFEKQLKVYGREGKPCRLCKTILKREKIGGRGTAWCPKCQK